MRIARPPPPQARCAPFKPTGGKSRASFIKTADDRFVLKRISAIERKHMLGTARKYFEHMGKVYHRSAALPRPPHAQRPCHA